MYKLVILAAALAICSATVVLPSALHYVAAPHSSAKVTKLEWEHKPVSYVAAVAPVAPIVTYAHPAKTVLHHAPLFHAAPVVHHTSSVVHHAAPVLHHTSSVVHHSAPIVHAAPLFHAAPLLHAPLVHSAILANKKA